MPLCLFTLYINYTFPTIIVTIFQIDIFKLNFSPVFMMNNKLFKDVCFLDYAILTNNKQFVTSSAHNESLKQLQQRNWTKISTHNNPILSWFFNLVGFSKN